MSLEQELQYTVIVSEAFFVIRPKPRLTKGMRFAAKEVPF